MEKKIALTALILIIPMAASVNLQTNTETPNRVLYPNETVNVNLSVENLDTRAAENTSIYLEVGERHFEYNAGDIEPGEEFNRTLELPEFPAGSYQAKATLNYTGFLDERFTETTRSGFRVRFPEFVRIPRQVYIQDLSVPSKVTAGEEKLVNAIVNHDGDIEGEFTAAVVSQDSRTKKEFELSPGNQRNLSIEPTFYTPGVSFAETRLYANLKNDLFLLDYLSEQVFVEESRVARVKIQDVNAEKDGSNAEIQVDLLNNGSSPAYDVNFSFSSGELEKINQHPEVSLLNSGEQESVNIEVSNPTEEISQFSPSFELRYRDGRGYHTVERNLSLRLNATSADVSIQNVDVEEDAENPYLSYMVTNDGEEQARDVKVSLLSPEGVSLEQGTAELGTIEPGNNESGELSFSVLKSSVEDLTLNLTTSYHTESGNEETEKVSTTLEGGYSEGAVCSHNWQCGTSSNPMSCSTTPSGGTSRCCPAGELYSSSSGSCLDKMTLVAVPLHYEDGSFQEFKQDTQEQVDFFLKKTPLKELDNPRSRIEVKYLRPSEVENPETTECGRLNMYAKDVVLDSQYRNSFDKVIATTTDFQQPGLLGCAYPYSNMEVTLNSHPKTMAHEMAHVFGLGHTTDYRDGCGAERGSTDYLNDAESDGAGEIMNYCSGDNYFSDGSDEYSSLKQVFQENGWMQ